MSPECQPPNDLRQWDLLPVKNVNVGDWICILGQELPVISVGRSAYAGDFWRLIASCERFGTVNLRVDGNATVAVARASS